MRDMELETAPQVGDELANALLASPRFHLCAVFGTNGVALLLGLRHT